MKVLMRGVPLAGAGLLLGALLWLSLAQERTRCTPPAWREQVEQETFVHPVVAQNSPEDARPAPRHGAVAALPSGTLPFEELREA